MINLITSFEKYLFKHKKIQILEVHKSTILYKLRTNFRYLKLVLFSLNLSLSFIDINNQVS